MLQINHKQRESRRWDKTRSQEKEPIAKLLVFYFLIFSIGSESTSHVVAMSVRQRQCLNLNNQLN